MCLNMCVDEEEDDETDETDEDQDLAVPDNSVVLGEESLEPPTKLARTELFNTTQN